MATVAITKQLVLFWLIVQILLNLQVSARATSAETICPKGCNCFKTNENLSSANCTSFNSIQHLPSDVEILSLVQTKLKVKDQLDRKLHNNTFKHLHKLKSLYLKNLGVSSIEKHSFKGLCSLTHIDLSNNFVSDIDNFIEIFDSTKRLKTINLSNNPINCSCASLKVRKWFVSKKVKFINAVVCNNPIQLKGKIWNHIHASDVYVFDKLNGKTRSKNKYSSIDFGNHNKIKRSVDNTDDTEIISKTSGILDKSMPLTNQESDEPPSEDLDDYEDYNYDYDYKLEEDSDDSPDDYENPQDNLEEEPQDNNENPQDNLEEEPQDNNENPQDNLEEETQDNIENPQDNLEEEPQDNIENPHDNLEEEPQDNNENPQDNLEEEPQDNNENSQDNLEEEPQDNIENPQDNLEEEPQDNLEEKPQDNLEEKPQDNNANSQVDLEEEPQDNNENPQDNLEEQMESNNENEPQDELEEQILDNNENKPEVSEQVFVQPENRSYTPVSNNPYEETPHSSPLVGEGEISQSYESKEPKSVTTEHFVANSFENHYGNIYSLTNKNTTEHNDLIEETGLLYTTLAHIDEPGTIENLKKFGHDFEANDTLNIEKNIESSNINNKNLDLVDESTEKGIVTEPLVINVSNSINQEKLKTEDTHSIDFGNKDHSDYVTANYVGMHNDDDDDDDDYDYDDDYDLVKSDSFDSKYDNNDEHVHKKSEEEIESEPLDKDIFLPVSIDKKDTNKYGNNFENISLYYRTESPVEETNIDANSKVNDYDSKGVDLEEYFDFETDYSGEGELVKDINNSTSNEINNKEMVRDENIINESVSSDIPQHGLTLDSSSMESPNNLSDHISLSNAQSFSYNPDENNEGSGELEDILQGNMTDNDNKNMLSGLDLHVPIINFEDEQINGSKYAEDDTLDSVDDGSKTLNLDVTEGSGEINETGLFYIESHIDTFQENTNFKDNLTSNMNQNQLENDREGNEGLIQITEVPVVEKHSSIQDIHTIEPNINILELELNKSVSEENMSFATSVTIAEITTPINLQAHDNILIPNSVIFNNPSSTSPPTEQDIFKEEHTVPIPTSKSIVTEISTQISLLDSSTEYKPSQEIVLPVNISIQRTIFEQPIRPGTDLDGNSGVENTDSSDGKSVNELGTSRKAESSLVNESRNGTASSDKTQSAYGSYIVLGVIMACIFGVIGYAVVKSRKNKEKRNRAPKMKNDNMYSGKEMTEWTGLIEQREPANHTDQNPTKINGNENTTQPKEIYDNGYDKNINKNKNYILAETKSDKTPNTLQETAPLLEENKPIANGEFIKNNDAVVDVHGSNVPELATKVSLETRVHPTLKDESDVVVAKSPTSPSSARVTIREFYDPDAVKKTPTIITKHSKDIKH